MADDILARLQGYNPPDRTSDNVQAAIDIHEAADEITRLRAEIAEFKSIRDLLLKALCKATGRTKDDVDLAPFDLACKHAAGVADLERQLAEAKKIHD